VQSAATGRGGTTPRETGIGGGLLGSLLS